MRIINAEIYTMDGSVIKNGYIETSGEKISGIGEMNSVGSEYDGEIIDAAGKSVYPGFVDAHTHLGMFEDSLGFEGDDGNEETDPCTPHLRAIDAVNPLDRNFEEAVDAGVTSVVTGPGSANAIGGQSVAMKTYGRCVDKMIIKAPVAMKFALGENPKSVYNSKNQAPITRMATAAIIREQLAKTQKYLELKREAETDDEVDEPDYDAKCEALIPLFTEGLPAHFHAHRCDDIFTAIRIAKEFGLNYTIIHGTQGHLIADELAAEGTDVLCGPLLCDRSKPELHDLTPASAGILNKAGVRIAIITDHSVVPIQYLPICAGLAVREGLDRYEALKAITINPAEICGISDRVGSLKKGKDADMVIFGDDPFSLYSKPAAVICGGKRVR